MSDSATTPATVTSYGYTPAGQRCFEATAAAAGTACSQAPTGATLYSWSPYQLLCTVGPNAGPADGCPTGQTPTAGDISYTYGANGLRTTETSAAGTTEDFSYALAGSQPLVLTDGTDAYIYGPANFGADTPPLEEISLSTGQATAIVSNPTGPQATVTSGGAQGTYRYGTYGTPSVSGAALAFGFQGAYQGTGGYANGLLYMVNRYYDPTVGQFISVDPAVSSTNQPYVFVGGDPINQADPLGLWSPWGAVANGFKSVWHGVKKHWRTIGGVVLGVAAIGLGVASLGFASGASVVLLGVAGAVAGGGAAALDYTPCRHGDESACVGLGLGAVGAGLGLIGSGVGLLAENSLPAAVLGGVGALGVNVGVAGTAVDAGMGILAPANTGSNTESYNQQMQTLAIAEAAASDPTLLAAQLRALNAAASQSGNRAAFLQGLRECAAAGGC